MDETLRRSVLEAPLETPELVVVLPRVRANVRRMAELARAQGVALRPHAKTHKLPPIARLQIEAGAAGIQVAKLGEAEVMVDGDVTDVLVGYPIVGERKVARLLALTERARIGVSLDSEVVARGIAAGGARTVRVLLEIDTGLRRVGVSPDEAPALAERIAALEGIELAGILTHEGHAYTQATDERELERLTHEACRTMAEVASALRERALEVEVVSVGSSATARFAMGQPGITEVRPGTYVFNDRTQIAHGAATEDDLAAFVVATVVSRPARDRAVLDAGTKSLTSDQMLVAEPRRSFGVVAGHGWELVRASEEHSVVALPEDADIAVGDRLAIVPNHVCPTVNLVDRITVVDDGEVERWPVAARGKVQ